jgi:hypothetical protein
MFAGILQQTGETGSAMVTIVSILYILAVAWTDSNAPIQTIAIYTFTFVMWGIFKRELLFAYLAIGFICVFLFVFIGITVGTQTHGTQHYMTPDGVSSFLQ